MQKELNYTVAFAAQMFGANSEISCNGASCELPHSEITALHFHDLTEVGICRSGHGLFVFGSSAAAVLPGDAILISPEIAHYSKSLTPEGCRCTFAYFDRKRLLRNAGISPETGTDARFACVLHINEQPALCRLLSDLTDCAIRQTREADREAAAYDYLFLLKASQLQICQVAPPQPGVPERYRILQPAIDKIRLFYAQPLSVAELAEACFLSKSCFLKQFRLAYGITPYAYLNRFRIQVGAEMLRSTIRSVTEIGTLVGYSSASDFYRHFVAETGCAPSAYRKRQRPSPAETAL